MGDTEILPEPFRGLHLFERAEVVVNVTDDDIAHGSRGNCHKCPVARAVTRLIPQATVSVSLTEVHVFTTGMVDFTASTGYAAERFIHQFDDFNQAAPEPQSFTLTFHRTA